MKLIACDPIIGLPRVPFEDYRPDRADLLAEMARLGVTAALVRHRGAYEAGPANGNRALWEEVQGHEQLWPVPFVTPDGEGPAFDPAITIAQMRAAGAKVCWTDPRAEEFSLLPWCSGPLYEVLQARRMPLLLEYDKTSADELFVILESFPALRLILLNVPRLGRNRLVYPLLQRFPNLMLCLSHTYSVHEGFEDLVRVFGPYRWVFGLGYPQAEGGAAIAGLTYARLSTEAQEAIGYGNIERLLEEVQ